MPRIPQENVDQIESGEAEGGGRRVVEGYVVAKLVEATESEEKESGYAGQDLKFEVTAPRQHKGTPIWEYLSYAPQASFRWRQFFDAVDYDYNSDTDEIIAEEELFVLDCSLEIQTKGKNKGKPKTKIDEFLPASDENIALTE